MERMTSQGYVTVLTVMLAACAHPAPLREVVTPQSYLGLGEGFGPGIVSAAAKSMTLQLDAPGHVIVLRILDDGDIEQVQPAGDGTDRAFPQGRYSFGAAPRRTYAPSPPSVPSGPVYPCPPSFETESNLARPDPACWTVDRAVAVGAPPSVPPRSREQESGYWLVIVSDLVTPARVLDARLRALELDDGPLLENVVQIPSALIGGRTTNWSAFYVGFAVIPAATGTH